jgi:hypothetical protein
VSARTQRGEIILTVAGSALTAGGAAVAKSAAMVSILTKLKQVTYLQKYAGRFDEIIALASKSIAAMASVTPNLRDSIQRVMALHARIQKENTLAEAKLKVT